MTFELFIYLILFLVTVLSCFAKERKSTYALSAMMVLIYIIVVRASGFDVDFENYIAAFKMPISSFVINPYYLKEWFYWVLSRYIYELFQNEYLVFLLYDITVLFIVVRIKKKLGLPTYFIGLYFLFFPSVFGLQNIYRQFVMTAFLILAVYSDEKKEKVISFALAVFTHNSALLFLPLLFTSKTFFKGNRGKNMWVFNITALSICLALPLFNRYKSSGDTGLQLQYVYVLIILLTAVTTYFMEGWKFNGIQIDRYLIVTYGAVLLGFTAIFGGSTQVERVGMIMLTVFLPAIITLVEEKIKQRLILRVAICVLLTVPTLLFSSALQLLLTSKLSH